MTDHFDGTPGFSGHDPPDQPSAELTNEERNWALICHLCGLAGYIGPTIGNIVAPLVVWLIKKDQSPFIDDQGKEALNFQITISIAAIISFLLCFVLIGIVLLPIVLVVHLVFTIMGAVKASNGEWYRYPLTIRLVK